jgi:hypothetical protein
MTDLGSPVELLKTQLVELNQAIEAENKDLHDWIIHCLSIDYLSINAEGYLLFHQAHHPLASSNTSVRLHRHIASVRIGRWVTDDEIVYFKNGDKRDFSIGNLGVTTRAEKTRQDFLGKDIPERRLFDPPCEELEEMVWQMPVSKVSEYYGVSGRAVKKRCVKLGIDTPPRGYWTMLEHGYTHDGALEELERRKKIKEKR